MEKKAFFIVLLAFSSSFATSKSRGLEIAREMRARNDGYIGEKSQMMMTLIDELGKKSIRKIEGLTMEVDGDGDRTLMTFLKPLDIKGTKLLTWGYRKKDDDQWLYLPSLRRVKRITSTTKTSSFMGSEFSYEDLGSQELEKYNFKHIEDLQQNGDTIHLVERVAKQKSAYKRVQLKFSKKYGQPVQIDYYNRRNELAKVAKMEDFQSFKVNKKQFFRYNKITMANLLNKKKSIFSWADRQLGVKVPKRKLSKNQLK